jgi:hypothetical protein
MPKQILPNVVRRFPPAHAVLSQIPPQQLQDFRQTQVQTFDQVHDQPHVRQ